MITRVERFRNNRIVVRESGFLVGIALDTSAPQGEFSVFVDRQRVIHNVAQYFADTSIHPVPFPIRHPVKRDSVVEIAGVSGDAVAYFTNQTFDELLHAEWVPFATGGNPASVGINPGTYDRVEAILGAEHDASYNFLITNSPTRVWMDGDLKLEGPLHTALSRPGYLRILGIPIRHNVTVEISVAGTNKPKAVVLLAKKITSPPTKPVELK